MAQNSEQLSIINQVGIFLDLDNLEIECMKLDLHLDPILLKNKCMELGRIRFLSAYADFTESGQSLRDQLALEGYAIMDLPSLGIHGKNSADIQIVVESLTLAYEHPDIDTFVLITGDADFNPLIKKLRQVGKKIVVIGLEKSTALTLKKSCDRFIAYEDIRKINEENIDQSDKLNTESETEETSSYPIINEIPYFDEFLRAVRVTQEKNGYVLVSRLKEIIVQLDPEFSEIKYGTKSFLDFLKIYENAQIIEIKNEQLGKYTLDLKELSIRQWKKILKRKRT